MSGSSANTTNANAANNITSAKQQQQETVNGYQIPKWAGKPPSGLHLDIIKEGKMIQKLMIDEKRYYFFGRNKEVCDFVTDHASCSRVHAVLIWHKHLNRSFLVDMGSAHGTFIGSIRLEPQKPQQVFIDSELKFGASTRTYIIRERPQMNKNFASILSVSNATSASNANTSGGADLNNDSSFLYDQDDHNNQINLSISALPESEAELDNLTEFNTAHNKRIAQLVDITSTNSGLPSNSIGPIQVKKKKKSVSFNEDEEIINPEDIDPTIGRFRNMIQTSIVIPSKKKRINQMQYSAQFQPSSDLIAKRIKVTDMDIQREKNEDEQDNEESGSTAHLYEYDDYEISSSNTTISVTNLTSSQMIANQRLTASNLGINSVNLDLAPDVEIYSAKSILAVNEQEAAMQHQQKVKLQMINRQFEQQFEIDQSDESYDVNKKKKYAKEAWPGRKPTPIITSSNRNHSPPSLTSTNHQKQYDISETNSIKSQTQSSPNDLKKQAPSASSNQNATAKRLII